MTALQIRPLRPSDQATAKALILAGLQERWGHLDPRYNADLDDIATHYAAGVFLLAWLGDELVGTGAFLPRTETTVEIVRMSVAQSQRRQGIGERLLQSLCQQASEQGYQRVILETTHNWDSAIAFYAQFGFQMTHRVEDDIYFMLDLTTSHLENQPQSQNLTLDKAQNQP